MHKFPENKRFAFSIFDDTDLSTTGNVGPVYHLLGELGMRTTKSVWPLASVRDGWHSGSSLQETEYLEFILALKQLGFEIALHNVRNHDSTRELIASGLERFRELIGHYPRSHANHSRNRDNIYWGASRFNSIGPLYRAGTFLGSKYVFEGEDPATPYFWGDFCRDKVDYVRNFVFQQINLDLINPTLPYHDPTRPFVKYWFSSCEGGDVSSFCDMICDANIERLEAEGGVCIMYTHFACGFVNAGTVNHRVQQQLRSLSKRNGWFVPVSVLLDHLRSEHDGCVIPTAELALMERRWALERVGLCAKHSLQDIKRSTLLFPKLAMSRPIETKRDRIVHLTSAHPVMDVRIFHKECRSLARVGFDVIQICNHDLNDTIDGVRIVGLGKNKGRVSRFTKGAIKTYVAALRCRGDLYHLHDPDILVVGIALRLLGKRVIYDIHEDLPTKILLKMYLPKVARRPLSLFVRYLENMAAGLMSGLVTATPALRVRFQHSNRNIVVVNNFPMLEEFDSAGTVCWETRRPSVAYFGGISEARGVYEMIQAVKMLPSALGVKLELAGWFYVESLFECLKKQLPWNLVNWHREVDRPRLRQLLRMVSAGLVVLHPEKSFVSSQPTKLFEYMAAGIPVIASDFPLWRSIVSTADCGLLVDPLDARSIAAAIESLVSNPERARVMGQRGRQAVEERFNWANEEKTLLSFYLSILRDRATETDCKAKGYSSAA